MWSRIKTTLLRQFIHDVPHELAACEFGCKVGECSQGKWARCERRTLFARRLEEFDRLSSLTGPERSEKSNRRVIPVQLGEQLSTSRFLLSQPKRSEYQ
jgi:hypothetical protein